MRMIQPSHASNAAVRQQGMADLVANLGLGDFSLDQPPQAHHQHQYLNHYQHQPGVMPQNIPHAHQWVQQPEKQQQQQQQLQMPHNTNPPVQEPVMDPVCPGGGFPYTGGCTTRFPSSARLAANIQPVSTPQQQVLGTSAGVSSTPQYRIEGNSQFANQSSPVSRPMGTYVTPPSTPESIPTAMPTSQTRPPSSLASTSNSAGASVVLRRNSASKYTPRAFPHGVQMKPASSRRSSSDRQLSVAFDTLRNKLSHVVPSGTKLTRKRTLEWALRYIQKLGEETKRQSKAESPAPSSSPAPPATVIQPAESIGNAVSNSTNLHSEVDLFNELSREFSGFSNSYAWESESESSDNSMHVNTGTEAPRLNETGPVIASLATGNMQENSPPSHVLFAPNHPHQFPATTSSLGCTSLAAMRPVTPPSSSSSPRTSPATVPQPRSNPSKEVCAVIKASARQSAKLGRPSSASIRDVPCSALEAELISQYRSGQAASLPTWITTRKVRTA